MVLDPPLSALRSLAALSLLFVFNVCAGAGDSRRPQVQRFLDTEDRQRCHADGDGGADASQDAQIASVPEIAGGQQGDSGIGKSDETEHSAGETIKGHGHEPAHRSGDDQGSEIVGNVRSMKAWLIFRSGGKSLP
jgi:hypothetical protein